MNVAVLGASAKPDRYSNRAVHELLKQGHSVFPVHPKLKEIDGLPVFVEIAEIGQPIDTITVYLNPQRSSLMTDAIIAAKPRRVIFNPGAENDDLAKKCTAAGIVTLNACTLVMLSTNQF